MTTVFSQSKALHASRVVRHLYRIREAFFWSFAIGRAYHVEVSYRPSGSSKLTLRARLQGLDFDETASCRNRDDLFRLLYLILTRLPGWTRKFTETFRVGRKMLVTSEFIPKDYATIIERTPADRLEPREMRGAILAGTLAGSRVLDFLDARDRRAHLAGKKNAPGA
ncbi:hypothetical protein EBZ80_03545 [bacterium]|nr:hypothetical protein [bacterium]